MTDPGSESPPNGLKPGKNGSFYTGSDSRYLRGISEGFLTVFATDLRRTLRLRYSGGLAEVNRKKMLSLQYTISVTCFWVLLTNTPPRVSPLGEYSFCAW